MDVAIIGAGPGGSAVAMGLKNSGLQVVLIDESNFPREKICGDAIPSWVLTDLEPYCAAIHETFLETMKPGIFSSTSMLLSNGQKLNFKWGKPGYMIPRLQFDNFLLDQVLASGKIRFFGGEKISKVHKLDSGYELFNSEGKLLLRCRVLIGADGASSLVAKSVSARGSKSRSAGHAVRAYYKNVNLESSDTSMVFFDKAFSPGYFWIFPLPDNRANVGFGMPNTSRLKRNIKLTKASEEFIKSNDSVTRILKSAESEGPFKGGILPFAGKWKPLAGLDYILVGDAANLLDPFSGDGIRNAVRSGLFAAETILNAFQTGKLNPDLLKAYESLIKKHLWPQLKQRAKLVKWVGRLPWLVPFVIRIGNVGIVSRWLKTWL